MSTSTRVVSGKLGIRLSDEDFRIKLAVEKALKERGVSQRQPGELGAKILLGVLAVAGIVFVLGFCAIIMDGRPMYGYWRRYWW